MLKLLFDPQRLLERLLGKMLKMFLRMQQCYLATLIPTLPKHRIIET